MVLAPQYPEKAIRNRIEGWAYFLFDLDGSGKALNIRIIDESNQNLFSKPASKALQKFGFDTAANEVNCHYLFRFNLG